MDLRNISKHLHVFVSTIHVRMCIIKQNTKVGIHLTLEEGNGKQL